MKNTLLFLLLFITNIIHSYANQPILDTNLILSYTGIEAQVDEIHITYDETEKQYAITINNTVYQYNESEIAQFRFIQREHHDIITKDQNVSLPIEMIHFDPIKGRVFEMLAMFNLVKYKDVTHTTVQSGNWSDPNTWGGIDNIPATGARVLIKKEHTVTIDDVFYNTSRTIRVDGTLQYATNKNTALKVHTMVVNMMGKFIMGTATTPIQDDVTAQLIIDKLDDFEIHNSNSPDYDPHKIGLGLVSHGAVMVYGAQKTSSVSFDEAALNTKSIKLDQTPSNWKIGDKIVIAGTQRDAFGDETRIITGIAGNTINFDVPLVKNHHSPNHTKSGLELKLHVINTTRNAVFKTVAGVNRVEKDGDEFIGRGHIMFMHTNNANVHYAGFYHLGRTNKQGVMQNVSLDDNGNTIKAAHNPIARYPVHFHRAGHSQMGTIIGSAVVNSPGWAYVNHRSAVKIENNVAYNISGASFISEAGDEKGTFINNVSIRTIGNGKENITSDLSFINNLANSIRNSNNFGSAGDGFWIHSQLLKVKNNVASGFTGSGFMFWNEYIDHIKTADVDEPDYLHKTMNIEDNISYGGYTGIDLSFFDPAKDGGRHQLTRQIIYNVTRGMRRKYSDETTVKDIVMIGDLNHPQGSATSTHSNGSNFLFVNPHIEGFVKGLDFEHRSDAAGVVGGYLNNVYNIQINTRHDRGQNVSFRGNIEFGNLSVNALANVATDNLDGFDGKQYDYLGFLDVAAKKDEGFTDASPNLGKGLVSTFAIEQADGSFKKAYLKTEQHKNFIPWTAVPEDPNSAAGFNTNWLDKTNLELEIIDPEGIFSGEYYDETTVEEAPERYQNIALEPITEKLKFFRMYLLDSIPDITMKLGTNAIIPLNNVFFDPNNYGVEYNLEHTGNTPIPNTNPNIATAIVTNDNLYLEALTTGTTRVIIEGRNKNPEYRRPALSIRDTIMVNVVNDDITLVANDDVTETTYNTSVNINVLNNDETDTNTALNIIADTNSTNGGSISVINKQIIYIPANGYNGEDSFSYTIKDIFNNQASANVRINVHRQTPDYTIYVTEGKSINLNLPFTVSSVGQANFGLVSSTNSEITYSQNIPNHNGSDEFTYTIGANQGTVSVLILPQVVEEETPVLPEVIFPEGEGGFESGGFTEEQWEILSNTDFVRIESRNAEVYRGEYSARLQKGGSMQKTVSTIGYTGITVSYYRKTFGLAPDQYFEAQWSIDGTNWEALESNLFGDLPWQKQKIHLPVEASNTNNLSIRFKVHSSLNAQRAFLDDVIISGTPMQNDELIAPEVTIENLDNGDILNFGNIKIDDEVVKSIKITNEGSAPLEIKDLKINNPNFILLTTNYTQLLQPNNYIILKLKANTSSLGSKQANISFSTNDTDEKHYTIVLESLIVENTLENYTGEMGQLTLFPNPSNGILQINNNTGLKLVKATVFNSIGQQLRAINLSNNQTEIDFENLPKGLYFINLYFEKERTILKTIIIN